MTAGGTAVARLWIIQKIAWNARMLARQELRLQLDILERKKADGSSSQGRLTAHGAEKYVGRNARTSRVASA